MSRVDSGNISRRHAMSINILPLTEKDLTAAGRIIRLAFGTFYNLPEPEMCMADIEYARPRFLSNPSAAFKAEMDGELVGSNFAARWGSIGFFGPLSVRPDLWDKGIGKKLMEPIMDLFDKWKVTNAGMFTVPHSPKHLGLYQNLGFWPRYLTAVMARPARRAKKDLGEWTLYSAVPEAERRASLNACRHATDTVYPGLDVELEIEVVRNHGLGDTVLLWEEGLLGGLGICHWGPGSEAGTGKCYVKFGAVRQGPGARDRFIRLLDVCGELAFSKELAFVEAGVNTARRESYELMLQSGFRTHIQGVVMQRAGEEGYNRPGAWLIDDWR